MAIRFDSQRLIRDFDVIRRKRKITLNKAAVRCKIQPSTLSGIRNGKINDITVTTLARMLDFMNKTDVAEYIMDDGE